MIEAQFTSWTNHPYRSACVAELLSKRTKEDRYSFKLTYPVRQAFCDMVQIVQRCYSAMGIDARVEGHDSRSALVIAPGSFVYIYDADENHSDLWACIDRTIWLEGFGPLGILRPIHDMLRNQIPETSLPQVTWEYMVAKERKTQYINIERAKPIHREFYPWIDDVEQYFDRYLASESSVLVLLGETGTAKTSFVRSMIWYANLHTMFTYEDELLKTDVMFVDFIAGKSDLLVVEDADLFLRSREHDGNRTMAKFLNISNGLASNGQRKKIIFTANLTDSSQIDSALLRAGRCFDCLMFRRLTMEEACAAAAVAGLPPPTRLPDYTLAELFAEAVGESSHDAAPRIGFTGLRDRA